MKRYVSSACFFLTGILTYFTIPGFRFFGIFLCGIGGILLCFALLNSLIPVVPGLVRFLRRLISLCLCLALIAAIPTGIWIGTRCGGAKEPESPYVIVLGAGVNGSVPSSSLRERLEATKTYLETYPNAIAVLSGGQGSNENLSEALCMYRWLTEKGIAPTRLRMEDKATSTEENIKFSLDLIEAETGTRPTQAVVISSEYHLARASLLAKNEGLSMLGYPAETYDKLYFCNMFLREIFATWYTLAGQFLGI